MLDNKLKCYQIYLGKNFMKLISWNVNGIRAVYNKGFLDWYTSERPEILCIQETKAQIDQFPTEIINQTPSLEYSSAQKKGYSGVATFFSQKPLDTKKMGIEEFDSEGRVLIHELEKFFLVNCYFPNSSRDHKRLPYKLDFNREILKKINELEKIKPVIITGDFNVAHEEIDLANPKTNHNTAGFLPSERAWFTELLSQGWVDIFRKRNPNLEGAYTWWSVMNPSIRERNIGWRIDYFVISPKLEKNVKRAEILSQVRGSDHCPILLELEF